MHQDQIARRDVDRAVQRLRVAGVAIGLTLLLLSPRTDQTGAVAAILGYAAIVIITRAAPRRRRALQVLLVGTDVLYAAGLSFLLPLTAGSWALYAFAIGTAALGFGAMGAAAATAASVVAYDVGLGLRMQDLRPADLWPVQLLLGIGLLIAELVWAVSRGDLTRRRLRTFAVVQRELMAAHGEEQLLDRMTDHAVRSFGAASAWIEIGSRVLHERGPARIRDAGATPSWQLDDAPPTWLRCTFEEPAAGDSGVAEIRDLAADAAPLLAHARARARLAHRLTTLGRVVAGVRALERDRVVNAVRAQVLDTATAVAGPSALLRLADGSVIAGDLAAAAAVRLARDTSPPALVRDRDGVEPGVVVAAGPGLVLVAADPQGRLTADDLEALATLGQIAALATERITERDGLMDRAEALTREVSELGEQLRARDDAVASAIHELRTPLTSVHAYAQLTSRNLQSVQEQVKRLDRLIADLMLPSGGHRPELVREEVDLLEEARKVGRRTTLVAKREVNVSARGGGPFIVRGDRSRIQQVLENLLGNAVKFSPAGTAVDVEIDRGSDEVIALVSDTGPGIPVDELEHIFERHYRGALQRDAVPGKGIGLAISRDIVAAHGGRIWAASAGHGAGSTFFVALPAAPVTSAAAIPGRAPAIDRRTG